MGHVWSVMDPQVGIGAEVHPLKHKTCHFGPMLDPLMSDVGPLADIGSLGPVMCPLLLKRAPKLRLGPHICDDPSVT